MSEPNDEDNERIEAVPDDDDDADLTPDAEPEYRQTGVVIPPTEAEAEGGPGSGDDE